MFGDGVQELDLLNENLQISQKNLQRMPSQKLLRQLFIGEQSLPSLRHIGNVIPSTIKKHPTPLKIAIGVYYNKQKMLKHMHDYLVCCSYDELLLFKKSSAVATTMTDDNPSQWKDLFQS